MEHTLLVVKRMEYLVYIPTCLVVPDHCCRDVPAPGVQLSGGVGFFFHSFLFLRTVEFVALRTSSLAPFDLLETRPPLFLSLS